MEEWKEIFDGYLVSTLGNVDSTKLGKRRRLKPWINNQGYLLVTFIVNGERKHFRVNRLVAQNFIPNPDKKPTVNHINGVKADNRVENLEWVTYSENNRHAVDNGLIKSGEDNYLAKLTNEQVKWIRDNPEGLNGNQLAQKFGVVKTTISAVQRGMKYKNAGGAIREKKF